MDLTESATRKKLDEYKQYINDKLRPDLEKAVLAHDAVRLELDDFSRLQKDLIMHHRPLVSQVSNADLGHGSVYCEAQVDDESRVFVNVGFGFHVELTVEEAIHFIHRRIKHLSTKHERCKENVERLTEHVARVEAILKQLEATIDAMCQ